MMRPLSQSGKKEDIKTNVLYRKILLLSKNHTVLCLSVFNLHNAYVRKFMFLLCLRSDFNTVFVFSENGCLFS